MPTCTVAAPSTDSRSLSPLADTGEFMWPPRDADMERLIVVAAAPRQVEPESVPTHRLPGRDVDFVSSVPASWPEPAVHADVPVVSSRADAPAVAVSRRSWGVAAWTMVSLAVIPGATVLGAWLGTRAARVPPVQERVRELPAIPWPAEAQRIALPGLDAGGPTTGRLRIETTPPGYAVMIAGVRRGRTPLTIDRLPGGIHDVQLAGPRGVHRVKAVVVAGRDAMLVWPQPQAPAPSSAAAAPSTRAGWLIARAPFEMRIAEDGRVVGTTLAERTMLPAGRHVLAFTNEELGLSEVRDVVVPADGSVSLDLQIAPGLVSINAEPWADVSADGRRLGETPLSRVSLPAGRHTLVFRHPTLGERVRTIVVPPNGHVRASAVFEQ